MKYGCDHSFMHGQVGYSCHPKYSHTCQLLNNDVFASCALFLPMSFPTRNYLCTCDNPFDHVIYSGDKTFLSIGRSVDDETYGNNESCFLTCPLAEEAAQLDPVTLGDAVLILNTNIYLTQTSYDTQGLPVQGRQQIIW